MPLPLCTLVNLTSASFEWAVRLILEKDIVDSDELVDFHIKTKYYTARVNLRHFPSLCALEKSESENASCSTILDHTEALLLYCDNSRESFSAAEKIWSRFSHQSTPPAVCYKTDTPVTA